LSDNKTELNAITGAVVTDFATPYGAYNADVVAAIKAAGYESHRSTDVGYNTLDSFNPYNIKVQNMTNTTTAEQVKAWVDEAIANKMWLVIVYHEVTSGTPAADATYAVTSTDLDAQLAYIKQTGVAVVTVSQALDEIAPQAAVVTTP
jgi:peptidoglycan/xylan/chitin deacetylase (PgdA/CDA1 family)